MRNIAAKRNTTVMNLMESYIICLRFHVKMFSYILFSVKDETIFQAGTRIFFASLYF